MIVRLRRHRALGRPLALVSIILVIFVTASFILRSRRYESEHLSDATDLTKPPTTLDSASTQVHEVIHSDTEVNKNQEAALKEEFIKESKELRE